MTELDHDKITAFALDHYKHERGTRRGVDEGRITLRDLTIYHYIRLWTTLRTEEDHKHWAEIDRRWHERFPDGIASAANVFQITTHEAERTYHNVHEIPRNEAQYLMKYQNS